MSSDLGTLRQFIGRVRITVEVIIGLILPETHDMYMDQKVLKRFLRRWLMLDSLVWHHDLLQCILLIIGLLVMVFQDEDESGNYSGFSSHVRLGLISKDICAFEDCSMGVGGHMIV